MQSASYSYIIDNDRFQEALQKAGYRTIQQLAQKLSIHRNTIHHFLAGAPVFPESISKIFSALGVEPFEILKRTRKDYGVDLIAVLTDALLETKGNMCIVLFGSRARGSNKKFSDFDLGVYSRDGMDHREYLKLLTCKDDNAEDLPVTVDLVNLNRADKDFLGSIGTDMRFIGGRLSDWLKLKGSVCGQKTGSGD